MRNKVIKDGKVFKPSFLGGSFGSKRNSYLDIQNQQLCLENNNEMNWSIQEENISKEEEIMNNYYNRESKEKNQLALLRDIEIEKNLDNKVNSMFCNDYSGTDKNNQEIFRKLIDQVNITIVLTFNFKKKFNEEEDNFNNGFIKTNSTDDCLYLHMLVPSSENKPKIGKDMKKDVFYEVGCKIFEVNKIIK